MEMMITTPSPEGDDHHMIKRRDDHDMLHDRMRSRSARYRATHGSHTNTIPIQCPRHRHHNHHHHHH
jgi:hypothetical protein